EVDKLKKNREKGNHQDRRKKRDNETRASTSKETRTVRERNSSVENKSSERPQADEGGPQRKRALMRTPDREHSKGRNKSKEEEGKESQSKRTTRGTPDRKSSANGNRSREGSGHRTERSRSKKVAHCSPDHRSSAERNRSRERSRQRSGQHPTEERSSNWRNRTASEERANRVQQCFNMTPGTPFQDALRHIREAPIGDAGLSLKRIELAHSYTDADLEREMIRHSVCRDHWCHRRKSERK
ncbi:MAG: hypothetical protein GY696_21375, partial [Gammaproteobacteria bacterium]|nr:hypothetical protein [Gammaproteobacteria bacterium]